jgi:hypothetical protein
LKFNINNVVLKKGNQLIICWIPKSFCTKEKYLQLKINDKWENGWKVESIGDRVLSESVLVFQFQDYKRIGGSLKNPIK